jgi:hypothetical protein
MKILVTFPRFGSTWIQKYINKYNADNYGAKDLYDFFGKKNLGTTLEKITFLETERAKGQEYSIKYFTYHEPVLLGWTKEFYKKHTVIKLIREDVYGAFLSYITQYQTGWKYHNAKSPNDLTIYNKECKDLNIDQRAIDEWFNRYRTFINFKDYDQEMIYEDFVPNDSSVSSTIKYNIDYESRINNISHVKEEYQRCMKLLN